MSQFMLCKSEYNLKELNCIKFLSCKINKELLTKVANKYIPIEEQKDLWVLQEIDKYCTETQKIINEGTLFKNTKLYYLLDKLYDKCTDLIVWYGSDYLQLDEISRRKDFFNLIEQGIRDPCCEIYIIIKKS